MSISSVLFWACVLLHTALALNEILRVAGPGPALAPFRAPPQSEVVGVVVVVVVDEDVVVVVVADDVIVKLSGRVPNVVPA